MSGECLRGLNTSGLHPALLRANQHVVHQTVSVRSKYSTLDNISEDVKADENEEPCSVCKINKKIIALFPCGHKTVCKSCIKQLIENSSSSNDGNFNCPLCRQLVKSFERVF
jgi:hypothetical protein